MSPEYAKYLLQYDSSNGAFKGDLSYDDKHLIVNGHKIRFTNEKDPEQLRWDLNGGEYIIESTGRFKSKELCSKHLKGGAKKALLTVIPDNRSLPEFIYGVNH